MCWRCSTSAEVQVDVTNVTSTCDSRVVSCYLRLYNQLTR